MIKINSHAKALQTTVVGGNIGCGTRTFRMLANRVVGHHTYYRDLVCRMAHALLAALLACCESCLVACPFFLSSAFEGAGLLCILLNMPCSCPF